MRFLSRSPTSLKTLSGSASYTSLSTSSSPPSSPPSSRWHRPSPSTGALQEDESSSSGVGRSSSSPFMKPLVALALPGMYLVYKYNQYKRQQQEANKRKAAEKEITQLNQKIDKLLLKLDEQEPEVAMTQEEECVICVTAKATMQTFPCGHLVVCRKCFVKTIQVAVSQRLLPLRCVVCRAKVLRLRQSRDVSPFPTSVSQYSMASFNADPSSEGAHCILPSSHSLYSFTSDSSWFSGVSNVSSASSEGGTYSGPLYSKERLKALKIYSEANNSAIIKKVQVSSKSGARAKEPPFPAEGDLIPEIKIENYDVLPVVIPVPAVTTHASSRVALRENKVAPQELGLRLPTIKEYSEFIIEKENEKIKPSSTRIRCAQKLVSQVEGKKIISTSSRQNNFPRSATYASGASSLSQKRPYLVYPTGHVTSATQAGLPARNNTVHERMWAVTHKEVRMLGGLQAVSYPTSRLWPELKTPGGKPVGNTYPPKNINRRSLPPYYPYNGKTTPPVSYKIPNPSYRRVVDGPPSAGVHAKNTSVPKPSSRAAEYVKVQTKGNRQATKLPTSASSSAPLKKSYSAVSSLSDSQALRKRKESAGMKDSRKKDVLQQPVLKKERPSTESEWNRKSTQKRKFNGKEYQRLQ